MWFRHGGQIWQSDISVEYVAVAGRGEKMTFGDIWTLGGKVICGQIHSHAAVHSNHMEVILQASFFSDFQPFQGFFF